jgi:hypothetical protein
MEEGRWDGDYKRIQGHKWDWIRVPICADGEQVSMLSASSNVLSINVQFIISCVKTH